MYIYIYKYVYIYIYVNSWCIYIYIHIYIYVYTNSHKHSTLIRTWRSVLYCSFSNTPNHRSARFPSSSPALLLLCCRTSHGRLRRVSVLGDRQPLILTWGYTHPYVRLFSKTSLWYVCVYIYMYIYIYGGETWNGGTPSSHSFL